MLGTVLRLPNTAGPETAPVSASHGRPSLLRPAFPREDLGRHGSPHRTAGLERTLPPHKAPRNLCEVLVRPPGSKLT